MTTTRRRRPIRVSVVADTDLVAWGVSAMLGRYPHRVVEVSRASPSDADLVLVDGSDPEVMVATVRELVAQGSPIVIVLGSTVDSLGVDGARTAGATGFVAKALPAHAFVTAVEAAYRGMGTSGSAAFAAAGSPSPWKFSPLSARELEVITLICTGLSNLEIAEELFLSINSVKTYIRSAYRKIGLTRRSQVVAWAFEQGHVQAHPSAPPSAVTFRQAN